MSPLTVLQIYTRKSLLWKWVSNNRCPNLVEVKMKIHDPQGCRRDQWCSCWRSRPSPYRQQQCGHIISKLLHPLKSPIRNTSCLSPSRVLCTMVVYRVSCTVAGPSLFTSSHIRQWSCKSCDLVEDIFVCFVFLKAGEFEEPAIALNLQASLSLCLSCRCPTFASTEPNEEHQGFQEFVSDWARQF